MFCRRKKEVETKKKKEIVYVYGLRVIAKKSMKDKTGKIELQMEGYLFGKAKNESLVRDGIKKFP